ncbi:MAG: hypothetical protein Q9175_004278, partial [Cornicularia normoerica]
MYISKPQSSSADFPSLAEQSLVERTKHAFKVKLNEPKGFDSYKGNIRGEYMQASFTILEDLFVKLPESVRFDVGINNPIIFEAHDWEVDTYVVDLDNLVDTILENVYQLAGSRTIFFSSFSPEICILLSKKQHVYHVLFLTEAGHIPSADARADSLPQTIHLP